MDNTNHTTMDNTNHTTMDNTNHIDIIIGSDKCWTATPEEAADLTELLDDMATLTTADEHEAKGHHKIASLLRSMVLDSEPPESEELGTLRAENTELHSKLAMHVALGGMARRTIENAIGCTEALEKENADLRAHLADVEQSRDSFHAANTELTKKLGNARECARGVGHINATLAEQLGKTRRIAEALRDRLGLTKEFFKFEWEL
ncbi:MAG: hypothetical protein WC718_00045 [Phycisphaerales bacterium]|jgi:hypothetical protein